MSNLIDKDALVAEMKKLKEEIESQDYAAYTEAYIVGVKHTLETISDILNTLEVKEADFCTISENLMEAYEYLDFTHTSNLAHNKPMVATRLKKAIQELYNAGLLKLTHDEKYRMENLGLKAQKGE